MLPYFWYLLKVIICSGILFGYYWLFLRNKIFHRYNRFYLLAAMSLSLVLPLLKIDFWQPVAQQNQAIRVLRAVSYGDEYMNNFVVTAQKSNWDFQQLYPFAYWLVSLIFFFVMLRTLFIIRNLLKKYPVQRIEEMTFVNTDDNSTPFSFLKYIFWNSSIDLESSTGRQIFKHEVAHIQEKHSYDKLFVNMTLVFFWCNPFFWLYRKELNMIHEFIADKKAVEDSDTASFAAMILQAAYPKHCFELTNNFFYSPIKRRLIMLTKIDNPRLSYVTRLMVLPLAVLIFAAFTFKAKSNDHLYHGKKITVVIDAGHGGQDRGASSLDKETFEKDITLAIAQKIKELNSNDKINIVFTRENDSYIPVKDKMDFSNQQSPDLFISFHIDSGPENSVNTRTGINFYVPRDEFENAEQSKILASALIGEFTNNYPLPVAGSPKQREKSIWTLQASTCPAVLIEAGFINNEKDLAYLKSDAAKETIAKNVLNAIEKFANSNKLIAQPKVHVPVSDTIPAEIQVIITQQGKSPLYILNGNKADSNILHHLNPDDILSVDVLKDNAAIAQYGVKGKDGVIIIKTKNYQLTKAEETIDPEKALVVVNGKIIGKGGKRYDEQFGQLYAKSATVKWLKKDEALAKYGADGAEGACEFNYTEGALFSAAYVDKDKVPVFYLGMDNPLTIAVQGVQPEDLVVHISEGSIAGTNGNYKVKVTRIGEVTLTLSKRDGTVIPASFTVKTKRIPEPNDPDFPAALEKLKPGVTSAAELKLKILHEQQAMAKLDNGERALLLKNADANSERIVTGRKLQELDLQNHKLLLEKQVNDPLQEKIVTGIKLQELDLQNQKLQSEQQANDHLKEKVVTGIKLQELDLQNQKLLHEKQANDPLKENVVTGIKLQELDLQKLKLQSEQKAKLENVIFTVMEQSPGFTGGEEAWRKYLMANLKSNTPVDEGWKAGVYKVILKFIVRTDGMVSDVTTENYKGSKTAQHCIDIIKKAPKWQPAVQNGRKVNAYKKQPITFVIEED